MRTASAVCPACGRAMPWSSPRLRVRCNRCWAPPPRAYVEPVYVFPRFGEAWRRLRPRAARRAARGDSATFGTALLAWLAAVLAVLRLL